MVITGEVDSRFLPAGMLVVSTSTTHFSPATAELGIVKVADARP